jgi:hypothetical protein
MMLAKERGRTGKHSSSSFLLPQTLVQCKTIFRNSWNFHNFNQTAATGKGAGKQTL